MLENPRNRVSGLKFKIWYYFLLFVLIFIIIVWVFQIVLLKPLYRQSKHREIKEATETIRVSYAAQSIAETEAVAGDLAFRQNLEIIVRRWDPETGQTVGRIIHIRAGAVDVPSYPLLESAFNELYGSGKDEVYLEGDMGEQVLAYARIAPLEGDEVFYFVSTPLTSLDMAVKVLNKQLVLVSLIAVVAAFLLSWFLSDKIGSPIAEMSRNAKKLAKGNYKITFRGNGYEEIDELADALNYTKDELSKTDQLRKELLANVSHDIRTPLTMIKAYAEMIRDLSGENKQKRDLHTQIIIDETDRLTKLVNDMLDLSKLESGANELAQSEFDLSELTSAICNRFRLARELDGFVIEEHIQPDIHIRADEGKIEQVIYNLISNGINYTGEDKTIVVNLTLDKELIRFEVVDSGPGIPPDELNIIWERYYRASETRKRPVKGSGLGLSIVRTILDAHRAKYGVNSTLGEGSCFYFEIRQNLEKVAENSSKRDKNVL